MAARRLNQRRWRNTAGHISQSYEDWRLQSISSTARLSLFSGQDSVYGVPAPKGTIWVKVFEVHPPAGPGWTEI